jgi:hypothetical protein
MSQDRRELIEKTIAKACEHSYRSLGELAELLNMNKHTLRAHYIYPMVKSGRLDRSAPPPAKSTVKYITGTARPASTKDTGRNTRT